MLVHGEFERNDMVEYFGEQYKVITEGHGEVPKASDEVEVIYEGRVGIGDEVALGIVIERGQRSVVDFERCTVRLGRIVVDNAHL